MSRHLPKGVSLLHEDRDILVVEKPAGLLTIATEQVREQTLYARLTDFVRKGNSKSRERVFIVHRLDREVSGLLVFARTPAAKARLQEHWDETDKVYHAVVHGVLPEKEGTISSCLAENARYTVHAVQDPRKGKLSHTHYRVLQENRRFSLVEITLLTGRKHQIRVHLADLGHPIAGDRKYGVEADKTPRLALHAVSLSFNHPATGERLAFTSPPPPLFQKLLGKV